jgi:hypothetical protein
MISLITGHLLWLKLLAAVTGPGHPDYRTMGRLLHVGFMF